MGTTIENGKINCKDHGMLTAVDCDTLQCDTCSGCFIYSALTETSTLFFEGSTAESDSIGEVTTAIN